MKKFLLGLSVAGLLFSGYVSAVKLFSSTCAFGSPCPYFLGYPACYTGFLLFLFLSWLALQILREREGYLPWHLGVAVLGVLFSGYMVSLEWPLSIGGKGTLLGLPTCVWGFIFFAAILGVSYRLTQNSSSTSLSAPEQ